MIVSVEIIANVFVTVAILLEHEHEHDFPHGLVFKPIRDSIVNPEG